MIWAGESDKTKVGIIVKYNIVTKIFVNNYFENV